VVISERQPTAAAARRFFAPRRLHTACAQIDRPGPRCGHREKRARRPAGRKRGAGEAGLALRLPTRRGGGMLNVVSMAREWEPLREALVRNLHLALHPQITLFQARLCGA
jgi:hypothetical protein